jgi:hypothetical protein
MWMCFVYGKYARNARTLPSAPQYPEDAPREGRFLGEQAREDAAERLERVAALLGEFGAVADEAAADVEQDEAADDDGVAGDAAAPDVVVQQGLFVEAEVAAGGQEVAPDHEGDHADEHEDAQEVGEEVVARADGVAAGMLKWK